MNVLDSHHVEVLAFDYLSFQSLDLMHNIWTWLAVITAAVSFWRIKTAGLTITTTSNQTTTFSTPADSNDRTSSSPSISNDFSVLSNCDGVVRKGKFTVYYDDGGETDMEEEEVGCGEINGENNDDDDDEVAVDEWWRRWESVLRVKKGDEGCYRFQDLTVIDGNVVRLWEEVVVPEMKVSGGVW